MAMAVGLATGVGADVLKDPEVQAFLRELARESRSFGKEMAHQAGLTQEEGYSGLTALVLLGWEYYEAQVKPWLQKLESSWVVQLLQKGPSIPTWNPFANL